MSNRYNLSLTFCAASFLIKDVLPLPLAIIIYNNHFVTKVVKIIIYTTSYIFVGFDGQERSSII
jgi:hypothetical protein